MKNIFKKIWYYFKKPYIGLPLNLIFFYLWNYYASADFRKIYKISFNCATVIKVIVNSDYKTQPSIVVRNGSKDVEIYQFYSYNYDFKNFTLGDKICKEADNFNFIRVKKGNTKDTVTMFGREVIGKLLFMPSKPYDESKLNCDCMK
jgi:hypothetical protein